jgi:hypothetical protein
MRSSFARAYGIGIVRCAWASNLDVIDAACTRLHHGRDAVESNPPSDDAIVRHDDHKRRVNVALDRLANGKRRALPPRQPHDASSPQGAMLTTHACYCTDILAIEDGLIIGDDSQLALAPMPYLEAIAHDQLPAAREAAVCVQRRKAFEQHTGTRI